MSHKTAFPVSATVAEAARNLAQQQKRLLLKQAASEAGGASLSNTTSLRKTTPRLEQPLDPEFEADNSMLVLSPLDVDYYDGNPRFELGEDYSQLKASIRAQGLNSKLSVTRRPGAARYMVEAGGNRRLRVLKELIEGGVERFRNEIFVFRAWKSESTVLLRHLSENMQRAEMTLFEEASGVLRLKRVLEEERGERYSLRGLEEILTDIGFPVTKSALSIYAFAVEKLATLGPATKALTVKATRDVLQSGLNRLARLAALFDLEEQALYEGCLNPVMEAAGRRFVESNAFDIEALYGECEQALATWLEVTHQELRQWLAVLRANPKAGREELIAPAQAAESRRTAADPSEPQASSEAPEPPISMSAISPPAPVSRSRTSTEPAEPTPPECPAVSADERPAASSRLEAALQHFAAAVGAEPYLRRHAALPLGFYMEVPDKGYAPRQEESQAQSPDERDHAADDPALLPLDLQRAQGYGNPHLYHGWWLLMQLSGLLAEGDGPDLHDDVLRSLPSESVWRQAADMGYEEIERVFTDSTGPKPDFAFILDWLTSPNHPLTAHLSTLLAAVREVRRDTHV